MLMMLDYTVSVLKMPTTFYELSVIIIKVLAYHFRNFKKFFEVGL